MVALAQSPVAGVVIRHLTLAVLVDRDEASRREGGTGKGSERRKGGTAHGLDFRASDR